MGGVGSLTVRSRVAVTLGDASDGVYSKFGKPHVVGMSPTRMVIAIPWRTASYAPFSGLRLLLVDQYGSLVVANDLPWIAVGPNEVPLIALDSAHLLEVTYVGPPNAATGVATRRIAVADSGFTLESATNSPAGLTLNGAVLMPALGMVVVFGTFGSVAGFLGLDVDSGAVLWATTDPGVAGYYSEFFVGPGGALVGYYTNGAQQPCARTWVLTRSGATPSGAGAVEPFGLAGSPAIGGHVDPAYAAGSSSLSWYPGPTVDCYSSAASLPSLPVSSTLGLLTGSQPYRRSELAGGVACGGVALDLLNDRNYSATLVAHTPLGAVVQVLIPDLPLTFGGVTYGVGPEGLGAIALTDVESPYIPNWVARLWVFTVGLAPLTPPPLRQVQRDDGLGRSCVRARGGTSVQRSIRQRGYR